MKQSVNAQDWQHFPQEQAELDPSYITGHSFVHSQTELTLKENSAYLAA